MALRHTLLGLLILQPRTGYALHKRLEEATFLLEAASLRRIYPTLKRLADEGLVVYEVEPQEGRPARKVYRVTEEGVTEFVQWLRAPADPGADEQRFFARFFFYGLLDRDTLLVRLQDAKEQAEGERESLRAVAMAPPPGPHGLPLDTGRVLATWGMMADYARRRVEGRVEWLAQVIARVQAEF